jgi:hypothetical protein
LSCFAWQSGRTHGLRRCRYVSHYLLLLYAIVKPFMTRACCPLV